MRSISKAHQRLSERFNDSRVLTNPEEFLGPNFEAVLNFWLILDGLSEEQWRTIESRYDDFFNNQPSEWNKVTDEAFKASDETIGELFAIRATGAVWDVYGSNAASYATEELLGMNNLFEQNKPLTFFPMILDL